MKSLHRPGAVRAARPRGIGTLFGLVSAVLAAGLAAPAQANRITDVGIAMDDVEYGIEVSASAPLSQPRFSTFPGSIKMWIPNIVEDTRLELAGDGEAFSRVRVRPGAGETSLVQIYLTSKARLQAKLLHVQVRGSTVVLKIPKRLVSLSHKRPAVAKARVPDTQRRLESDSSAVRRPPAGEAPVAATHAVDTSDVAVPGTGPVTGKKLSWPPAAKATEVAPLATGKGALSDKGQPTTAAMFMAGFILLGGAALLYLKKTQLAKLSTVASEIEVLGSKRLGPKHQLVLVRALGEEHLLSMNGERTERLASTPCTSPEPRLPEQERPSSIRLKGPAVTTTQAEDDLLTATFRKQDTVQLGLRAAANDGAEHGPSTPRSAGDGPFGAELMSMMAKRIAASESVRPQASPSQRPQAIRSSHTPPTDNGASRRPPSAVDGLLKLRKEAS